MLKKTTSNYIKLFNITITTCAIIVSSLFFCKEIKAEQNYACEYETVTNAYTGQTYCMPKYIYESQFSENPNSNYADDYRRMVRTGNIGAEDIRILEQYAEYNYFRDQFYKNGIQGDFDSFWNNEKNRIGTYFEGVWNGTWWRNNMSMLKLALGWNDSSMPNNTSSWQAELQSMQQSGNRNYYTGSQNNVYNYGDTNYYNFYDNSTNQFFYLNNYYAINNINYNFNTSTYTYNVDNSQNYYFNVVYNIDNTQITIVQDGQSATSTYYFKLPDGRNSYNLTSDQLNGLKVDLTVGQYSVINTNDDLIALYHLEGNKNDSSINGNNYNNQVINNNIGIKQLSFVGLPDEYQQVAYIQSNSDNYIDSGVALNGYYHINISCDITQSINNMWSSILGYESSDQTNTFRIGYNDQNLFTVDYNVDTTRYVSDISNVNGLISISNFDNKGKVYYQNELINEKNVGTINTNGNSLYVFALNNKHPIINSANQFINGKLYYIQIYDRVNNLVSYLVPCYRKSDSVIGLYDLVNNRFCETLGTGLFTIGEFIYPPYYQSSEHTKLFIEPNSISYINSNSNFGSYLYLGQGHKRIVLDYTNVGNTIDFRFYPVANDTFTMSLGDVDISIYSAYNKTVEISSNNSTTTNQSIVSYSQTGLNSYESANSTYFPDPPTILTPCNYGSAFNVESTTSKYTSSVFYDSNGRVKYINVTQLSKVWSCRIPNDTTTSGTQTIPVNEKFLVYNPLADFINFGEWNHIAVQKSGELFINGKYIGNYPNMINGNNLIIDLLSGSYSYIDEIRITKSNKYNKNNYINGLSFNPPSLPYDTNLSYILPDTALNGTLLIQSMIPVRSWQFGGVRPSNVQYGDVYVNITDLGLLNSLQQFDGTDWINVLGAIYNENLGLWINYYGYSIYTNNWSYNDLTEMNPNDIQSQNDFYGWLGAWFSKINTSINNIKMNVIGVFNNDGDDITNEIKNEHNVDINFELNNNIENLVEIKTQITQSDNYNITPEDRTDVSKLGRLITETLNVYNNNGLGWIIFLILILVILGVIL